MAELIRLWRRRRADNFQMQLRYWNLIGKNSGLMFVLYAAVIIGGFYYKRWLDVLPQAFPAALAVTAVLSVPAVRSPIRTFMQPADKVFLLPVEAELGGYFRMSRMYSFIFQSLFLIFFLLICAPLYAKSSAGAASYWIVAAAAIAVKGWNIDCRWQEQSIDGTVPLKIIRFGFSFLFLYGFAGGLNLAVPAVCAAAMLISSIFLFRRPAGRSLLKWDRVIDMDNKQEMQFLRFANLFTDVPRLRHRVKARRLISALFPVRSFDEESVYRQLFIKTFLRADDYFGIYLRLTAIGALVCFFVNNGYYTALATAAFVYLTGLQLLPLWYHPFPQALAGLYPIAGRLRRRSFLKLIFSLFALQSLIMSLAGALGSRSPIGFLLFLAAGMAAGWLFTVAYTKQRLEKEDVR